MNPADMLLNDVVIDVTLGLHTVQRYCHVCFSLCRTDS